MYFRKGLILRKTISTSFVTPSLITTALVAALALGGCGPKAQDSAAAAGNSVVEVADETGNDISNAASNVADAMTPAPTAQEFADQTARSDAFEIASAKLAKDKASSAELKSFAAMMITDHTASTAKVKDAALIALPPITPDPTLTADQQDKLAALAKLSGAAFDKAYADQQIKAHEDALTLMQTYIAKGDFRSLAVAAAGIAPKVQSHLDQIKTIRSTL